MTTRRRARRRGLLLVLTAVLVAVSAAISPIPAPPAGAAGLGPPLTFRGAAGLQAAAASLRVAPNGPGACLVGPSATTAVDPLPPGATLRAARVQWAASGSVDDTIVLNGHRVVAEHTTTVVAAGGDAFAATADVTALMTPGDPVTVTDLTVDDSAGPCGATAVFGGFALFVVYDQAGAPRRRVVLHQGLDVVGRGGPSRAGTFDDLSPASVGAPATLWALAWEGDDFGGDETVQVDGLAVTPTGSPPGAVWDSTTPAGAGRWGVDLDPYALDAPLAPDRTALRVAVTSGEDQILVGALALVLDEPPRPPVALDDHAELEEDGAVDVPVAANDSDPDGDLDPSSVVLTEAPARGVATVVADGVLRYTPRPDANGPDDLGYQVCDRAGLCATATVHLVVTARPDGPVAGAVEVPTIVVPSARVDVLAAVVDADDDVDPATLRIVDPPDVVTAGVDDGAITVVAPPGYTGRDHLRWEVCDRSGLCAQAQLAVPVALAPSSEPVRRSTTVGAVLPLEAVALGGVVDPLQIELGDAPQHGRVEVAASSGTLMYRPAADFTGTDMFTYQTCDFAGVCRRQAVVVTVTP